jgi:hypothetical protein
MSGSFKAALATSTATIASRFDGGTWIRRDGVSLASTDIFIADAGVLASLNVRSDGTYSASSVGTWAGASSVVGDAGYNCVDWTFNLADGGGLSAIVPYDGTHLVCLPGSTYPFPCNQGRYIYCFQQQ